MKSIQNTGTITEESNSLGPTSGDRALTIGEASQLLGVSVATLRNWDRTGKLPAIRHPFNRYRLYSQESVMKLRNRIHPVGEFTPASSSMQAETRFDVSLIAPLALAEKQIQQSYRPYIQVHKWFARRPGTLFRGLLLAEFSDSRPLSRSFFEGHDLSGLTVLDPFIGGGTPVLEANRLGMNVIGCDINPMATWVVRQELASIDTKALRRMGQELVSDVEQSIERYYSTKCLKCDGHAQAKYYIWVKTIPCGDCGQTIELFPGYLVASNARHPNFVLHCPECHDLFESPTLPKRGETVTCSACAATWTNEPVAARNRYSCRGCGHTGSYPDEVRQHGPPVHSLIAIEYHCATCKPSHSGRFFKAPDERDHLLYQEACSAAEGVLGHPLVPDESIPAGDETTRLHRWGYQQYADLFNPRQLLSLSTLASAIVAVPHEEHRHALATIFSDFLRYQNMLGRYDTSALKCQDIFSVHGFPVGLVQCENNVLGIPKIGTGGYLHFLDKYLKAKEYNTQPFETKGSGSNKKKILTTGERIEGDFTSGPPSAEKSRQAWISRSSVEQLPVKPESVDAVLTDPPYFNNVQYAELMDFCYVWLRRLIQNDVPYFSAISTRTDRELTGNKTAGRDLAHFCEGLSRVYCASTYALKPGGLFAFTYHHNDPEAYYPVAVALLDAGLIATSSIPCPAEMTASLHIAGTSSSVVDTILCSRKIGRGALPSTLSASDLPTELYRQAAQLRAGGVIPTTGDLRCMTLGLITVLAVNSLRTSWQSSLPTEERLDSVCNFFSATIVELGGLDKLARAAATSRGPSPSGSQLDLPLSKPSATRQPRKTFTF